VAILYLLGLSLGLGKDIFISVEEEYNTQILIRCLKYYKFINFHSMAIVNNKNNL